MSVDQLAPTPPLYAAELPRRQPVVPVDASGEAIASDALSMDYLARRPDRRGENNDVPPDPVAITYRARVRALPPAVLRTYLDAPHQFPGLHYLATHANRRDPTTPAWVARHARVVTAGMETTQPQRPFYGFLLPSKVLRTNDPEAWTAPRREAPVDAQIVPKGTIYYGGHSHWGYRDDDDATPAFGTFDTSGGTAFARHTHPAPAPRQNYTVPQSAPRGLLGWMSRLRHTGRHHRHRAR